MSCVIDIYIYIYVCVLFYQTISHYSNLVVLLRLGQKQVGILVDCSCKRFLTNVFRCSYEHHGLNVEKQHEHSTYIKIMHKP